MKRAALCALAFATLHLPHAFAAEGNVVGMGGLTCAQYLRHRQELAATAPLLVAYSQWQLGYVAAYNALLRPAVHTPDALELSALVAKQCADNPRQAVGEAMPAVIRSLGGRL